MGTWTVRSMDESEESGIEVPIGAVLAGKYRVDRVLGAGGMGVVVAAYHLQLDQQVAIKMLLPSMLKHREAVERFTREARAAVKIKSEHVARVSDVGTLETGAPYMVMEYLDGQDLGHWVSDHGALGIEQAVEFVLQAGEAIAEAHALGIVHRDIKPANLFCVRRADGLLSVKVLDFGISKLAGSPTDLSMTKTQTVMGSPHYMAPEQLLSAKNADAQSDIWSLGAVLYELLAGQVPFEAETFPELVLKVSGVDAPFLTSVRPDVPEELAHIVARTLQRDRDLRFKNLAELAVALVPFGPERRAETSAERIIRVLDSGRLSIGSDGLPSGLPTLPVASRRPLLTSTTKPGPMTPAGSRTVAAFTQTADEGRGKSRKGYGLIAAFALVIVGLAVWLARPKAPPPEAASPPPRVEDQGAEASASEALPAPAAAKVAPAPAPTVAAPPPAPEPQADKPTAAAAPAKKKPAPAARPTPTAAAPPPPPAKGDSRSAFGGRL